MITQARLHEMFEYRNGDLYRKISLGCTKAGDKAGHINSKGYVAVNIDGKNIAVHRLVWLMQHGEMPTLIDHIDNNRQNNKIENLRLVDRCGNAQNKLMHKNNSSGVKGVYWSKGKSKWAAQICYNHKQRSLGYFDKKEEAAEVVSLARDMLHGQYANHALTARVEALEGTQP